jgi:hypothetical protein
MDFNMKPVDKSILTVLADILGLDPKSKDINTKILTRLKNDKTIPKELRNSAMSVIVPTPSESKQMNFKDFRKMLDEASSTLDTIQTNYGYSKVDPSAQFSGTGVSSDTLADDDDNGIPDDAEELTFEDLVKLGAYSPEELVVTDHEDKVVDDLNDLQFFSPDAVYGMEDDTDEGFIGSLDDDKYETWDQETTDTLRSVNDSRDFIGKSLNEALSIRGRLAIGRSMARRASQLSQKRKLSLSRPSSPSTIEKRAHHLANALFYAKILKGKDPTSLTPAEKQRLEVLRAKNAPRISKMIPKLIQVVKTKEKARLLSRHSH